MKDDEVIAYQARRITKLEIEAARSLESERQLLEILRLAGINVTQVELNPQEAEFLRLYRQATPEGKAMIEKKVEAEAERTRLSLHVESDTRLEKSEVKKAKSATIDTQEVTAGALPKEFFKSSRD